MAFLKNAWYVAAWAEEVDRTPMARTLLGESVLMYRREDGQAVAMGNRCPHRHAPLCDGRLVGDAIECPYHGLKFDTSGTCVDNPHGRHLIVPAMRVDSYTLVERYGALWIWMGDAAPDESLIPDFGVLNDVAHYRTVRRHMMVEADYRLVADNVLDLTHIVYVHKGIGGLGFLENESNETQQVGNQVWCRRRNEGIKAAPAYRAVVPDYNHILVDKQQNIRWDPPANLLLEIVHHETQKPDSLRTVNYGGNLLTPETEGRTHYFWSVSRGYALDNEALDAAMEKGVNDAFAGEDKPIIEAQQRMMNLHGDQTPAPVLLETDVAAMRARRVLEGLIATEAKSTAAH